MSHHDDGRVSNPSDNPHFSQVLETNLQRRRFIQGGMGAAAMALVGLPALTRMGEAVARALPPLPSIGFASVPAAIEDAVVVPQGYSASVLYRWGDATGIRRNMPEFAVAGGASVNSAAEQAAQAGMDHDGMHYFPLRDEECEDDDDHHHGRRFGRGHRCNAGLLVINHENIQPEFLFAAGISDAERVAKGKAAHGMSVIEIRQDREEDEWAVKRPSRYARRVTADTPIRISGPAAGHPPMRTAADPAGRQVLGTLNNCANGATPWGTYLTCEENFNGYFGASDAAAITTEHRRYGVGVGGFGYGWHLVDERFDVAKHPNEPNRFGWVVELDPKAPHKAPVKRTALGRFKHENAALVLSKRKHAVVYLGDDERNEYIYKYVSRGRYHGGDDGGDLLDEGTLHVARFDADGRGTWIPLVFGENGLTRENGFVSQADVLIKTRQAADRVGATMMDRPEWISVHPHTHEVYCTLTNNSRRGGTTVNAPDGSTPAGSARPPVDAANPRANNVFGHIIRWNEAGGDAAATTFEWEVFVLAGDPANANPDKQGNIQGDIFGSPDGLFFDPAGRLWIQTDYGPSPTGDYANMGNCQMLCADVTTGEIRRFLRGANGCEITGVALTPDGKSMFVNIQHPGEGGSAAAPHLDSVWPDGAKPARSSTVVITKDDGGVIGS